MHKNLLSTLVVFFLFLLVGCQSNKAGSGLFSSFTPLVTPSANLAQTVQEALMRHDDLAVSQVHVQTRQDVVILTGYVKKIRLSDTAEQIARQVPGVRSVENHIIIRQ
ncbi:MULTISPECIES: BON domain-containing protein [Legionella]|uniref:BON domain-containing protein n=1 Tax=Legionella resiliens TaxID=2905958 RepID=A0ABS8X675_9GAMM|nr:MULTISPECIES: BON domain-containing protein [unclassified Legionella]MCE0724315.1 BON domain-containing protein [Legionella sp. 9fVS26]MCE3533467.1 BON domain-containing protein [Legionella sp. 8cVS16]QLZ69652.1 BON domain-containing protein [Legionella sp. PC1000]